MLLLTFFHLNQYKVQEVKSIRALKLNHLNVLHMPDISIISTLSPLSVKDKDGAIPFYTGMSLAFKLFPHKFFSHMYFLSNYPSITYVRLALAEL